MDSIEQEQTYEIKYIFLNHPVYARARAHTHTPPHTHTHTHTQVSQKCTHILIQNIYGELSVEPKYNVFFVV